MKKLCVFMVNVIIQQGRWRPFVRQYIILYVHIFLLPPLKYSIVLIKLLLLLVLLLLLLLALLNMHAFMMFYIYYINYAYLLLHVDTVSGIFCPNKLFYCNFIKITHHICTLLLFFFFNIIQYNMLMYVCILYTHTYLHTYIYLLY